MPNRISHLLAFVTIVLTIVFTSAAQTDPSNECPNITVDGDGITPTRDSLFRFKLKGLEGYAANLSATWTLATSLFDPTTVTINGQGTSPAESATDCKRLMIVGMSWERKAKEEREFLARIRSSR